MTFDKSTQHINPPGPIFFMQAEEITQQTIAIFDRVASGYDHPSARFFPFAADRLISHLKPKPGSKVLDIATGTGMTAIALGQVIGPTGRVFAVDLSEGMLDKAQKNITKMALDNIDLHTMDAASLDFRKNYFDAATCTFGIFFLPDMVAGLKEWSRVTKPGGAIIFTSFGANAFQPMSNILLDRLQDSGVDIPQDREQMGWYKVSSPEQARGLMKDAGLADIEIKTEQLGYHLASETDWWEIVWNTGYRGFIDQLPHEQLDEFRKQHLNEIAALKKENGIWLDVEVLFCRGTVT